MAADEKVQALYGSFKRLRDFPLDPSSIFDTIEGLNGYLTGHTTAYVGQVAVVLNGDKRGIYYIVRGETQEKPLDIVKAMDVEDEAELMEEFGKVKDDFDELTRSVNLSIEDIKNTMSHDYISREEFDKVTNLDTEMIDEAIDSLGEVILILRDLNSAITKSGSFRYLATQVAKLRKLLPNTIDLNDGLSADEFNPTEGQILVTKDDLNALRADTRSVEKVAKFQFGENLQNESIVLGSDTGFTITEIRIEIEHAYVSEDIMSFNLVVDRTHELLISKSDLSFVEPATFIFLMDKKTGQKSKVLIQNGVFGDATGTIMIKYFE